MSTGIVRITKNLSFDQVRSGAVSPILAYKTQVTDWIIGPARVLATILPRNTDHGMAILALELLFFEPHGQFINGTIVNGKSRLNFISAFDKFRVHLKTQHILLQDADLLSSAKVYEWARCGLFHSSLLATELLVDAVNFSGRPLARNPFLGGWLIDPWLILNCLEAYLNAYVSEVENNPSSALATNFNETFGKLFSGPLEQFSKL
jgi:hypothetical protein